MYGGLMVNAYATLTHSYLFLVNNINFINKCPHNVVLFGEVEVRQSNNSVGLFSLSKLVNLESNVSVTKKEQYVTTHSN